MSLQERRPLLAPTAPVARGTFWSSVFNLTNSAIGTGILAFPFAFRCAGLQWGTVLCFLFAAILGGSLHICAVALAAGERRARCGGTDAPPPFRTYQDLVRAAGGPKLELFMLLMMLVYLFGICMAFLVIVGDMAAPYVLNEGYGPAPAWLGSGPGAYVLARAVPIGGLSLVVVFPLCALRSITALRHSGLFAIGCCVFVVLMVVLEETRRAGLRGGAAQGGGSPVPSAASPSVFGAIPIFGYAFGCHLQLPLVWSALRPELRRVEVVDRVVLLSYAICLAVYVPTGVFGLLTFGTATPQDILAVTPGTGHYELWSTTATVARAAFLLSVTCCFPLAHLPARSILISLLARSARGRRLMAPPRRASEEDAAGAGADTAFGGFSPVVAAASGGRRGARGDGGYGSGGAATAAQAAKQNPMKAGTAGGTVGTAVGSAEMASAATTASASLSSSSSAAAAVPDVLDPEAVSRAFIWAEAFFFVCGTAALSVYCSELATVLDLVGSLCGSCEIFLFPGLFWWIWGVQEREASAQRWMEPRGRWGWWARVAARGGPSALLWVLGMIIMVLGTRTSIQAWIAPPPPQ